jgi:hypothetical protein
MNLCLRAVFLTGFLTVNLASGQRIGVGVKLGSLISDPFAATNISTDFQDLNFTRSVRYAPGNSRLTVGPMVELRLPRSFAIELSALHRRIEYLTETRVNEIVPSPFLPFDATLSVETKARNLDIPVLLKYRFPGRQVQYFLAVGGAARWVFDIERRLPTSIGPLPVPENLRSPPELSRRWNGGPVAAAGFEWRAAFMRIAPEIRYTRWASPSFRNVEGGWFSPANQLELLFSVGF